MRVLPAGLLDAATNLTYGVPYLANAYRLAAGNHERAIALYKSGYYYEAKRKGLEGTPGKARPRQLPVTIKDARVSPAPATPYRLRRASCPCLAQWLRQRRRRLPPAPQAMC